MQRTSKAFTLIELLVVIAIIAILAAILFPVFAQAKAAAKKIVSVSNMKQLVLASIMYSNDYDDYIHPATAWGPNTSGLPLCFDSADCFGGWNWLTLPYVKTGGLDADPQGPNQTANNTLYLYPEYGMNYTYLSAWTTPTSNTGIQTPVSMTSVARPASTVLLANKWGDPETNLPNGYVIGFRFTTAWDGPILDYTIELPNCYSAPGYCANNWGIGSWSTSNTYAAGNDTGGMTVRAGNQSVVGFIDGHAKSMTPASLAVGTNYSTTIQASALVFTSSTAYNTTYMWNGL